MSSGEIKTTLPRIKFTTVNGDLKTGEEFFSSLLEILLKWVLSGLINILIYNSEDIIF